jgi:PTH1 family peptidyl-tRNA hydrolase
VRQPLALPRLQPAPPRRREVRCGIKLMPLLVGLGNPGARYVGNRHNIGFMTLEAIAKRHGISPWRRRFQGVACEGPIGGERVLLLLPGTFMNESGRAVAEAAQFYKLAAGDITVFHDEIELPPGKVRVKVGGGIAGHNGLRSITAHVGNDYRRVRIGVGHPGAKDLVEHYVLSDFAKSERPWVEALLDILADNIELLVRGQDASFQNKVHLAMAAKGFGDTSGNDSGDV